MFAVRFHLARGVHYKHWQIKDLDGKKATTWLNPESDDTLLLWKCKLVNNRAKAEKILKGEHKSVCAWIACEDYVVTNNWSTPGTWTRVKYNPRKCGHWHLADKDDGTPSVVNIDNAEFSLIYTFGLDLFAKGLDTPLS